MRKTEVLPKTIVFERTNDYKLTIKSISPSKGSKHELQPKGFNKTRYTTLWK